MFIETFNTSIAVLVVLAQVIAALLLYFVIFYKRFKDTAVVAFLENQSLRLITLVSFVGIAGSLTYSNIIGFEPCVMCWWQRIFQYPVFIISFLALALKETSNRFAAYVVTLSTIGLGFSVYHYLVQMVDSVTSSCDVFGQTASCAGYYVFEFGYITIPMMALTIFVNTILLSFFYYKKVQK
ncbi:MAG: disulfide bond formation protein B [Candidatus Pacebacteria bacterium]|nr:disulfide bond formation protein B [Candidatus Paceibacterota bacterium]MCD8528221.1 disulfide bond formation protein B [Candidatus Paceibacterota bacterium]MCD8563859.1 disulfide bond formation protein B [Candidatus Paceibacterota bacterium]